MSTLRYAPQVISDAIAELNSRQNSINELNSQVASLTSQVNTLTDQVNTLTVDLDNVYDVIVDNTVGVEVVEENIDQYGIYCQNIMDAYDTIVADKDATISTKNTLISTYEGYFSDICNNISSMDGTVDDPIVFSKVADYVLTIPQSGSSPTAYIGYLNDIYTIISGNNQGIVVTSGDYQNFDTNIQDIFDSYDGEVSSLSSQVSTLTSTVNAYVSDFQDIATAITAMGGTVGSGGYSDYDDYVRTIPTSAQLQAELDAANALLAQYRGYFADIATAITNKGGTVTDPYAYDDFDDYVTGIPSGSTPVVQHGTLDWFKLPQNRNLTGMDFREVTSGKGAIVVFPENSSYLFANCGVPEYNSDGTQNEDYYDFNFYADKFDMSACTNIEGVFQNSNIRDFLPLTSNFCKNVQADVTLDLTCCNVDFDKFKDTIERNTTGYKREFLLKHSDYEANVGWGGVAKLRNKGYTVTDANPEES